MDRRIAALLVVIVLVAAGLSSRILVPTALEIRFDDVVWQSVEVGSQNLERTQVFRSGDDVVVSPISHGVYEITVTLNDGRQVWLEYLHTDAGSRRRVYVDVMPSSGDDLRVNQYARPWPFLLVEDLFDGTVTPESTSETDPARLAWM